MEREREGHLLNFVSGLVLGAVLGAGIALLTAPASGRRTRKRLRQGIDAVGHEASERWEDLSDDVKERVEQAVRGARKRFS